MRKRVREREGEIGVRMMVRERVRKRVKKEEG